MFEKFLQCNDNCVQPLIYTISSLPILVILVGMLLGLLLSGKLSLSILLVSLIVLIFFVLIFNLLQWCCKNKLDWAAWFIVGLPYLTMFFTAMSLSSTVMKN